MTWRELIYVMRACTGVTCVTFAFWICFILLVKWSN